MNLNYIEVYEINMMSQMVKQYDGKYMLGGQSANDNFNPFEFKLKGWSEQMNDDIDEYYDVLGELYEKYFKSGKPIPPELKLMLMLGGSAVKFHIAHTAIGTIPSLSDAMKRDPALAQKLNEQVITDKIKEQHAKQRETFEKKSDEQHQIAKKRADDLRMLKEKELEFVKMQQQQSTAKEQEMQQQMMQQQMMQQQMMQQQMMQQQILDKQRQLEKLQKQLNMQRSDSKSMYTTPSVQAGFDTKSFTNQKTMRQPFIPSSLRNKMSLMSNKAAAGTNYNFIPDQMMREQYLRQSNNDDNVSIDPNIDNIINDSLNDTQSRISDDRSRDSKASKISKRSRRKPIIKIDT